MKVRRKLLSILIALLVALTFVPITGQAAFADETQRSFDVSGQVAGLTQSAADLSSVTIKWNAYEGAEKYEVCRSDKQSGTFKKIATVTGCSYKDNGNTKLGKNKYYKVRACATVDSAAAYSKYSSVFAAKPRPGKPSSLASTGTTGSVTLSWTKVSGATGYQIYRATSKSGEYTKLGSTKNLHYTNTTLTKGKKYYYKVRTYKKKGKTTHYGYFTSPIEGMTKIAGPGSFNAVLSENGTVACSWDKMTGAEGYRLERSLSKDDGYVTVAETTETSVTDTLTESGQYYYRVRAFATVNGKRVNGISSSGGRSGAVNQARAWVGCKESNGSHKKIINVYNNYGPKYGKISYSTSWCAAFVSAVAIKSGNASVIPIDCYCPRMMNNFANKTTNKKYTPKGGDVVYYDWNANKVPDHVGMIEKVSGDNVTAIEGNYSDMVKRRTFKKGYSLLLAYGLPQYMINNMVSYTAPETGGDDETLGAASVTEDDVLNACSVITEVEPLTEETVEPEAEEVVEAEAEAAVEPETEEAVEPETEEAAEPEAEPAVEPATEYETAEKIIEYIQEEDPAAGEPVTESEYDAFLVYGICDEMDIDACVVTLTDSDGAELIYNEVVLDGELYILNAAEDSGILEKYTPEEIN